MVNNSAVRKKKKGNLNRQMECEQEVNSLGNVLETGKEGHQRELEKPDHQINHDSLF